MFCQTKIYIFSGHGANAMNTTNPSGVWGFWFLFFGVLNFRLRVCLGLYRNLILLCTVDWIVLFGRWLCSGYSYLRQKEKKIAKRQAHFLFYGRICQCYRMSQNSFIEFFFFSITSEFIFYADSVDEHSYNRCSGNNKARHAHLYPGHAYLYIHRRAGCISNLYTIRWWNRLGPSPHSQSPLTAIPVFNS